ncbi:aspartate/glutamate racemase family protein [Onishia taeanensis]|nr:aspartate/glutamate racemase family protein [Halomonas taeanensis]
MKKIGMLGGVGWPSTAEYYRTICRISQSYWDSQGHARPLPTPEIAIESLNMSFAVNNRGNEQPGSWDSWDHYYQNAMESLESAGAELLIVSSITPHARISEISKTVSVPVLSAYHAIGTYCLDNGFNELLILGTLPTMSTSSFVDGVSRYGIKASYPEPQALRDRVGSVIESLYLNQTQGASAAIVDIVQECIPAENLANVAVCLGCTELPMAFGAQADNPMFKQSGISFLNSTVIHAQSAFDACLT